MIIKIPHPSRKLAFENAIRHTARGFSPIEHVNPKVGNPHFHAIDHEGNKKPEHYEYPRRHSTPRSIPVPEVAPAPAGGKAPSAFRLLEDIWIDLGLKAPIPVYSFDWKDWAGTAIVSVLVAGVIVISAGRLKEPAMQFGMVVVAGL